MPSSSNGLSIIPKFAVDGADIHSTRYEIGRRYMLRLQFEYLIDAEPPRLVIDAGTDRLVGSPSTGTPMPGAGA